MRVAVWHQPSMPAIRCSYRAARVVCFHRMPCSSTQACTPAVPARLQLPRDAALLIACPALSCAACLPCREMLTAEMLPLQQAAAAAAAEKAARDAALAAGGFPGAGPHSFQEQQHRVFSSKRSSNGSSSSGRGGSLAVSFGLGSSLHTASGSRSRSHSHGRSPAANGGGASGVNSAGSGGTPGYAAALSPGRRPYE